MTHRLECSRTSTGDLMINEIDIRNYKCFEHLEIKNCRRVNIVVGKYVTTSRIAQSYFVVADGEGNILSSTPTIARVY